MDIKYLRQAKNNLVFLKDTFERKEIDEKVRLMALLHYKFQVCEALSHVSGFSEIYVLRNTIRHNSAHITLEVLSKHIEELVASPLPSIMDDLLASKLCSTPCSFAKYEEKPELEIDALWASFRTRLELLPLIFHQLSRFVKESGRQEIVMEDLHREGDITSSLKGIYLVLGEIAARLAQKRAVPRAIAQDPIFSNLIKRGNDIAHREVNSEISPVPENYLLELLLHGHKLLEFKSCL